MLSGTLERASVGREDEVGLGCCCSWAAAQRCKHVAGASLRAVWQMLPGQARWLLGRIGAGCRQWAGFRATVWQRTPGRHSGCRGGMAHQPCAWVRCRCCEEQQSGRKRVVEGAFRSSGARTWAVSGLWRAEVCRLRRTLHDVTGWNGGGGVAQAWS